MLELFVYKVIHILQASKFKTAVFPIAGAVIGTVVAGPVGLFAGAKIGAALGLGIGGTAGSLLLTFQSTLGQ